MKRIGSCIAFILFIQIFIQITSASTITLGTGVNITNGSIIKLAGLNCSITVAGNYSVTKFEVYSDYFLIYAPLTAPIYVSLPYNYNSITKVINITCTANTTQNLYINWNIPDGYSCLTDDQCSGGYCVHSTCRSGPTYCGDGYCDSGESCTFCPTDCGQCPGGFLTPTKAEKGKAYLTIRSIYPAIPKNLDLSTAEIAFSEIEIAVNNWLRNVKLVVEKTEKPPVTIENAYSYIKISKENIEDENIQEARIKFKVEKSWIEANSIDPNTVVLNRYDNEWKKLNTTKLSEDEEYVYYEALTPGFSYFAITGEKIAITTTITTTTTIATTTTTTTTTIPPTTVSEYYPLMIGILIILIVMLLLLRKPLKRRRK